MPKPLAARFFVDENDLALARALASARGDVVYPGHDRLPEVPKGTLDPVWLPIIGGMGLVVITRDQHIRKRIAELREWKAHRLRGFALTGKTSQSTWASLSLLVRRWDAIEQIIEQRPEGPWLYSATANAGPTEMPLPD